ncbi:MAG: HdeD family acid-resistance protein [Candidatus Nanopelagicales bacterium]
MTTVDQGPADVSDNALGSIGSHWGILLFLGITSVVVGIIALVWPGATVLVIAILLAIWLIVSGVFEIVRGFARGLSGGMRALLFITGILSVILGIIAFRSVFQAVEILAIFVGIMFLFRGFGALFMGAEQKEGRGWNIFGGIIMLIGGLVILVWPAISLVTLAWVAGIWLIVGGLFEIIASFRLRSAVKAA